MDIRKVKKLIELLEASDIAEIEIKEGDDSVRISRNMPMDMLPRQSMAPPAAVLSSPAMTGEERAVETPEIIQGTVINSPMVGTFYSAPAPEEPAFVKVGDSINVGDTLCIIEAMKIMNKIESEVSGTLKSINAKDGDAVEFDQILFVID